MRRCNRSIPNLHQLQTPIALIENKEYSRHTWVCRLRSRIDERAQNRTRPNCVPHPRRPSRFMLGRQAACK